jgi:hypothetical protein
MESGILVCDACGLTAGVGVVLLGVEIADGVTTQEGNGFSSSGVM